MKRTLARLTESEPAHDPDTGSPRVVSLRLVPEADDQVAPDSLSRDTVTMAALQLADLGGLDCVTHHQLGLIFGCPPEHIHALYATRADLVDAMCEHTIRLLAFPSTATSWQGWIHTVAARLHQLASTRPGGLEALALRPLPDEIALAARHAFDGAGFTEDHVTDLALTIWASFIGLALAESHSTGTPWDLLTQTLINGIAHDLPGSGAQIRLVPQL